MTMTDTEAKALALVNDVCGATYDYLAEAAVPHLEDALCRAIERLEATEARHAAELREQAERFSEVLGQIKKKFIPFKVGRTFDELAAPFILPAPDPLVEVILEMRVSPQLRSNQEMADELRAALAARGGKIVWEDGE